MEKTKRKTRLRSFDTGTTHPGLSVHCDLEYLRSKLTKLSETDLVCQKYVEGFCRDMCSDFAFLPPKLLEEHIARSIEANGPTIRMFAVEIMISYFVTQLDSKLDEAWDSLVLEALSIWPDIGMDKDSGGIRWSSLRAQTIERLAKPLVEQMKKRIGVGQPGRKPGSGLFRTVEDFQLALEEVFAKFLVKPSEIEVIDRLRQQPLCQQKTSSATPANQTRTFSTWLRKAGFRDIHDAWRKHSLARKSGK